jgi:ATP-dependent RNA helicase DeaD
MHQPEPGFTRMFINAGKADNFYPNQLIELINKNMRKRVQIGKIDLLKSFSFFEIEDAQAKSVMDSLNKASLNGRSISVEIAGEDTRGAGTGRESRGGSRESRGGSGRRYSDRPASAAPRKSREERGYAAKRGPKRRDDNQQSFRDEKPDFNNEEGWARRKSRK